MLAATITLYTIMNCPAVVPEERVAEAFGPSGEEELFGGSRAPSVLQAGDEDGLFSLLGEESFLV